MTDIVDKLRESYSHLNRDDAITFNSVDTIRKAVSEIERLRDALLIADTACRSYWGWEYGRPGDVDDDDVPDSSLLVKWRRDYEVRTALKENDQ